MSKKMISMGTLSLIAIVLLCASAASFVTAQAQMPSGAITGMVVDGSGKPIPLATVTLTKIGGNFETPESPQMTVSSPVFMGVYVFYALPPGTYNVVASKADASGTAITGEADNIVVSTGTITSFITIPGNLGGAPAAQFAPGIAGLVLDENKNVIPGAQVVLSQNGANVSMANNPQTTGSGNSAGMYSFGTVPAGTYDVTAYVMEDTNTYTGTATVTAGSSGGPFFVVLPGFAYFAPADTSTPTPQPTVQPSPQPATVTATPLAQPTTSLTASVSPSVTPKTPGLVFSASMTGLVIISIALISIRSRKGKQ